ncbi:MAG: hypothetical protein QOH61_203 [Chloroflexota bacterium]|jgi:hypothetical protein|nr:hypothetical protein [Chloroflexota bacterium]
MILNIVLWVAGVAILALGILRIQAPLSRYNELGRLAGNAQRYDSWRGGRSRTAVDGGRTGADEMRDQMRQRVYLWAAAIVVGIVLIVAGFIVR